VHQNSWHDQFHFVNSSSDLKAHFSSSLQSVIKGCGLN
jgi:hypothetical protein